MSWLVIRDIEKKERETEKKEKLDMGGQDTSMKLNAH